MDTLLKNFCLRLAAGFLVVFLSACSGGSGSGSSTVAVTDDGVTSRLLAGSGTTTTLGTRRLLSQANTPVTDTAGMPWKRYERPADYPNVYKPPLQFITLKSGKKLGVRVGMPADISGKPVPGGFPAIVMQTAYRNDAANMLAFFIPSGASLVIGGADIFMIKRGYVTVTVDIPGSGVSDGVINLISLEEQATYGEVVDWVKQQSWSNGKIGLAGTSYLGITSLLTAAQRDPAVKAAFVDVPMGDAWRGIVGTGGMLNGVFVSVWLQITQTLSVANGPAIAANPQYADQITAANKEHVRSIDEFYLPLFNKAYSGELGYGNDDGNFWSDRSPIERAKDIQVPTFVIGATNDIFQRDEPLIYEQLKRNVTSKLLIVPGAHFESIVTAMFNTDKAPEDGAPSSVFLLLQWFDKYLKDIDTGADKMPNVTQYVNGYGENGASRFITSTDWPHPQIAPQRLYLHGDMSLSANSPASAEPTHTVAEPRAPSVKTGKSSDGNLMQIVVTPNDGSNLSMSMLQWTLGINLPTMPYFNDNTTVDKAQSALNFDTAPLNADYYINGPMQADIWMSSTATEAALSVRVADVAPDGTALPISNGLMSAAYRAVDESRSRYIKGEMIQPWHAFTSASALPVTPGEIVKVPVEIFPNAALIRKGHKLRISISASNQAQGIWTTPAQARANGGITTIYNDASHPSSIVMPYVPTSTLN